MTALHRAALIAAVRGGASPDYLFFWGHTPQEGAGVGPWVFSQWWDRHPFEVDGERFATAEHWMMAAKARLMGDEETRAKVLNAETAADAKKLGRAVRPWDEERWRGARFDLVTEGNTAKFGQHVALRDYLVGTGDRVLVEASPRDRIWGIGLGASDEAARDPARWRGENLLGFALMKARAALC